MKQTKFTTSICQGALSLVLALSLALSLGSCTKESLWQGDQPGGDGIEVRVTFAQSAALKATTRAPEVGTPQENRLDHVTILVFNKDGSKLETVLSQNVSADNATELSETQPKWASDQTLVAKPVIKQSEPKVIYAIANWGEKEFDKATYTEAMLKAELTTIIAVADMNKADAPMLMSGSKQVENLPITPVTVDMARQAAKIKAVVTLKKEVQNKLPNIEWQTGDMKIMVAKIPNKSYIIPSGALPTGITWLNSAEITVVDTNKVQTVPATKDLTWSESIYINENTIADIETKNATYILVQLPYKNRTTGVIENDNYYKLYVNNPLDATSPYKVLRNTIYNFKINIIGIGLTFEDVRADVNVENVLTVNSWDNGEIIEVVDRSPKYFNIDRTSMVLQMDGKSLISTIVTDVTDWKLIDADGKTLLSFAENKKYIMLRGIAYTLGGTASAATISVRSGENTEPAHTQELSVIARNIKVPFTVVYDNGFIPNQYIFNNGPNDKLPIEGGLQVATRGVQLLPGEVAGTDPIGLQWKPAQSSTIGVELVTEYENAQFGIGKSNTDVMIAAGAGSHPAAEYCRKMGPGWYLPSVAELSLICRSQALLGDSYKLDDSKSYWSSTEHSQHDAWSVFSNANATTGSVNKSSSSTKIRCVKG